MTFGTRLRHLRLKKQKSQSELAKEFKITAATLSQYESGRRFPDLETLLKFADYFEVSLDYLLGRTIYNSFDKKSRNICQILGEEIVELVHQIRDFNGEEKCLLKNILEFIKFKREKI